jgi:plasmid stabilization system protein ParE
MPRGDKSKYSEKQKREAQHIEEGYEQRGVPDKESKRRAWATVNKMHGGGAKGGSGSEKITDKSPARKGGKIGGSKQAIRPAAERSASARKAARTRKSNRNS